MDNKIDYSNLINYIILRGNFGKVQLQIPILELKTNLRNNAVSKYI